VSPRSAARESRRDRELASELDFEAPFPREWFHRPTVQVARALLGSVLARRRRGRIDAARIVETEAYLVGDPASHSYRGPTQRNRSMFGEPGTLYVFRIHQVHCANVVTQPGEAVLLRAGEPVGPGLGSTRGPGRLARELGLSLKFDGVDLTRAEIRVLAGAPSNERVACGPRIGISKAKERPLRFYYADNRYVSGPRASRARPT
jgi:DNA-3-methyladenine glycosylase